MKQPLFKRSVIVVISNPKGGVGKTTATVNLGWLLATTYGLKVCLIDGEKDGSLSNFRFSGLPEGAVVDIRPGYHADLQRDLPMLRQFYDVILVDTAGVTPEFGVGNSEAMGGQERVSLQSLAQADMLIVPINPSPVDIRKTVQFVATVERWMMMRNGSLCGCMLLNEVKRNERLTQMVETELTEKYSFLPLLEETIRDTTVVKQAFGAGQSVVDFEPRHPVSQDYQAVAETLVIRLQEHLAQQA